MLHLLWHSIEDAADSIGGRDKVEGKKPDEKKKKQKERRHAERQ